MIFKNIVLTLFVMTVNIVHHIARAECLARGLYVLLALISFYFLNKPLRKIISGSTELIFVTLSPYIKYLFT